MSCLQPIVVTGHYTPLHDTACFRILQKTSLHYKLQCTTNSTALQTPMHATNSTAHYTEQHCRYHNCLLGQEVDISIEGLEEFALGLLPYGHLHSVLHEVVILEAVVLSWSQKRKSPGRKIPYTISEKSKTNKDFFSFLFSIINNSPSPVI